VNLYAYVGNDPVNMTDPTGEDAADIVVTGGRLVAGCARTAVACGTGLVGGALIYSLLRSIQNTQDRIKNGRPNVFLPPSPSRKDEVDVTNPDSVEGKTREEVAAAAEAKGWIEDDANNGKGKKFSTPSGNQGIRIMEGGGNRTAETDDEAKIKEGGPYAVIFGGKAGRAVIPLSGNRTLGQ
jgi:hypothetical protein